MLYSQTVLVRNPPSHGDGRGRLVAIDNRGRFIQDLGPRLQKRTPVVLRVDSLSWFSVLSLILVAQSVIAALLAEENAGRIN